MSNQGNQQNQQGGQGRQQGGEQKPGQQQQQPKQKPSQTSKQQNEEAVDKKWREMTEPRPEQRDQQKQKGGHGQQAGAHLTPDQISFYDESLKKQIEGSFTSDGNYIHVSSAYGVKSVPYSDLGACIDYNSQVSLVRKLLSELARDPSSGTFKEVSQQRDDQQLPPMQRGESFSGGR